MQSVFRNSDNLLYVSCSSLLAQSLHVIISLLMNSATLICMMGELNFYEQCIVQLVSKVSFRTRL